MILRMVWEQTLIHTVSVEMERGLIHMEQLSSERQVAISDRDSCHDPEREGNILQKNFLNLSMKTREMYRQA